MNKEASSTDLERKRKEPKESSRKSYKKEDSAILNKENSELISPLNYEESLKELDIILNRLQNDEIPIEELQKSYLKGQQYLQQCEELLTKIEKSVIEIDSVTLET